MKAIDRTSAGWAAHLAIPSAPPRADESPSGPGLLIAASRSTWPQPGRDRQGLPSREGVAARIQVGRVRRRPGYSPRLVGRHVIPRDGSHPSPREDTCRRPGWGVHQDWTVNSLGQRRPLGRHRVSRSESSECPTVAIPQEPDHYRLQFQSPRAISRNPYSRTHFVLTSAPLYSVNSRGIVT